MKLILDSENSHPTTITVKGKEITLEEDENTLILAKPITVKNIDLAIKKLLKYHLYYMYL